MASDVAEPFEVDSSYRLYRKGADQRLVHRLYERDKTGTQSDEQQVLSVPTGYCTTLQAPTPLLLGFKLLSSTWIARSTS